MPLAAHDPTRASKAHDLALDLGRGGETDGDAERRGHERRLEIDPRVPRCQRAAQRAREEGRRAALCVVVGEPEREGDEGAKGGGDGRACQVPGDATEERVRRRKRELQTPFQEVPRRRVAEDYNEADYEKARLPPPLLAPARHLLDEEVQERRRRRADEQRPSVDGVGREPRRKAAKDPRRGQPRLREAEVEVRLFAPRAFAAVRGALPGFGNFGADRRRV
mmetsp:Transcript_17641/g.59521  ORF Transcript_17641/g.59521 Transcript_17641/m.59521 type:complete len:222 (+) Transcript_17641:274-939(+)